MAEPALLALLEGGTRRLVRSVDAMTDEQWASPSLLPGWSRAHVVAHLALNAEALSAAIEGVHEGRPVPMYATDAQRDADIEELAAAPLADLRARLLGSSSVIGEWIEELADNLADQLIERTPGGRTLRAGDVGAMRVREVEIHHADLGLDLTAADWSPELVDLVLATRAAAHAGSPFTAHATDLGRSYAYGEGGPTVSGTGAALAWWVTGRGSGEGLTSDDGRVPGIEAW